MQGGAVWAAGNMSSALGPTPGSSQSPWKMSGPQVPWKREERPSKCPSRLVQVPHFTDGKTERTVPLPRFYSKLGAEPGRDPALPFPSTALCPPSMFPGTLCPAEGHPPQHLVGEGVRGGMRTAGEPGLCSRGAQRLQGRADGGPRPQELSEGQRDSESPRTRSARPQPPLPALHQNTQPPSWFPSGPSAIINCSQMLQAGF